MKKITFVFFLLIIFSCKNDEKIEPLGWITTKIAEGGDDNGQYASIYSYIYNNKTVYLFNYVERCCDFFSAQLFDENGISLCYPYGGISGQGNLKCQDFDANKSNEKIYWKK